MILVRGCAMGFFFNVKNVPMLKKKVEKHFSTYTSKLSFPLSFLSVSLACRLGITSMTPVRHMQQPNGIFGHVYQNYIIFMRWCVYVVDISLHLT